jgi:Mg2+-importing ATPase
MSGTPAKTAQESYWRRPLADVLAGLGTSSRGLIDAEAAARRQRFGPNVLRPHRERAAIIEFLAHFRNPLVLVLLAVALAVGLTPELLPMVVSVTLARGACRCAWSAIASGCWS